MPCAQRMLLFLVLAGISEFYVVTCTCSYSIKSPVLMKVYGYVCRMKKYILYHGQQIFQFGIISSSIHTLPPPLLPLPPLLLAHPLFPSAPNSSLLPKLHILHFPSPPPLSFPSSSPALIPFPSPVVPQQCEGDSNER